MTAHRTTLLFAPLALLLACLLAGTSLPRVAAAYSITIVDLAGQVTLAPDGLLFHSGTKLRFATARPVPAFRDGDRPVAATVHRVGDPADPPLADGRRLCGGLTGRPKPITFVAVWTSDLPPGTPPRTILGFFSGRAEPTGTAMAGFCGSFVTR